MYLGSSELAENGGFERGEGRGGGRRGDWIYLTMAMAMVMGWDEAWTGFDLTDERRWTHSQLWLDRRGLLATNFLSFFFLFAHSFTGSFLLFFSCSWSTGQPSLFFLFFLA